MVFDAASLWLGISSPKAETTGAAAACIVALESSRPRALSLESDRLLCLGRGSPVKSYCRTGLLLRLDIGDGKLPLRFAGVPGRLSLPRSLSSKLPVIDFVSGSKAPLGEVGCDAPSWLVDHVLTRECDDSDGVPTGEGLSSRSDGSEWNSKPDRCCNISMTWLSRLCLTRMKSLILSIRKYVSLGHSSQKKVSN